MKAEHLELSKAELFDFMKRTRNKEEYRRVSAIKQKLEGLPYMTIVKNLDVNYRNVYNWIKEYKEYGLDGIRSKRNNAGRIPKISSDKNKKMIKEIISKSPGTFGYLKNTWSIRLLAAYLTTILGINVSPMQTWRIVHDLGIVSKRPKLALEHAEEYDKKKKIVDNYKKVSAALLKKNPPGI
ncbi:MAG: helix-turn-helix domain-containing protein [Candidatus Nitrosopolaris sp.]